MNRSSEATLIVWSASSSPMPTLGRLEPVRQQHVLIWDSTTGIDAPDAWVGAGPVLGWGRIYGGQVVAQALRAAGLTIDDSLRAQSLHAYFVQAGDERQPVLYEVERVRDSGSFATRQVVAYQARGAVLNLIASFHRPEIAFESFDEAALCLSVIRRAYQMA